ncbi:LicD family protein [Mycoplasma phocoeninasale]|uniref:LicD family protein n=1 Tax=Mycoplasma phocoeninasale TaxID=2726117 RepID=A0A858U4W9_9MOLU|nr:hypothetical protein [Mycoplasma phocoeninasale]QJG66273.1 LicD family protein [Mycoplasma phocoeninasale]
MNKIFQEKNRILEEFANLCQQNSIWYSMDNHSLLAIYSSENWDDEKDHHDVMMSFEAYEKLKVIAPNRIIDSTMHSEYYSAQNKFVDDNQDLYKEQPFININLIVPTKVKNIKKYISWSNKIRSNIAYYSTWTESNITKYNNKIKMAKFLKLFFNPINYKDIINILYTEDFEGFIVTENPITKNATYKWLSNLSYDVQKEILNNIEVYVIQEYDQYLRNLYGQKYQISKPNLSSYFHKNIIEIVREENQFESENEE